MAARVKVTQRKERQTSGPVADNAQEQSRQTIITYVPDGIRNRGSEGKQKNLPA